jgi:DNA invertase Pin-like site-specific DNA recombinase
VFVLKKGINHVVVYLRKSRGDEEDDVLKKHRERLVYYAQSNGWTYDVYEEIGSGSSISTRPAMMKVLNLVEKGIYDGILVVAYDRLSRGSSKDLGEILEACQLTDTLIITPEKIYNPNDSNDLLLIGFQGVVANNELRQITQRFVQGKIAGTKNGYWTNGKPPYPYLYIKELTVDEKGKQKVIGTIIVDETKAKVYEYMKSKYISGEMGFEAIAFNLNKKGIPAPNGSFWSSNTVQRILIHEFHMGISEYGRNVWRKTRSGQRKIVRSRPDDEIARGNGTHIALKTLEEHKKINEIKNHNNKVPKRSQAGINPTSGILYCRKCGSRMGYSIGREEAKTGRTYHFTKCTHKSPIGIKCKQSGIKMTEEFYDTIYQSIICKINIDIIIKNHDDSHISTNLNLVQLNQKRGELKECHQKLNRILTAFENGLYTMEQFYERKKVYDDSILVLKNDISSLENCSTDTVNDFDIKMLKERIEFFKANWYRLTTNKEKNRLLKSTVKKITYDRVGDIVTFEIEYF